MARLCLFLTATIYIFYCLPLSEGSPSQCNGRSQRVTISINGIRNESGEWVTRFSATQNTSVLPKNMVLDLSRAATECHGNHIVNIQGIIKETSSENVSENISENACEIFPENKNHRLFFHNKCSDGAGITNNGRTLLILSEEGDAAALTNKPLRDNEVFTIRIDKSVTKTYGYLIGITTHSPSTIDVPNHLPTLRSGTWLFHGRHLYHNGSIIKEDFLETSMTSLKAEQHIGVMRSKSGNLHFFLDGVHQGLAASNISENVYGAFQIRWGGLQGTIID